MLRSFVSKSIFEIVAVVAACELVLALLVPRLAPNLHPLGIAAMHTGVIGLIAGPLAWWSAWRRLALARRDLKTNARTQQALRHDRLALEESLAVHAAADARQRARAQFLGRLSEVEHISEAAEVTLDALQSEVERAGLDAPRSALLAFGNDGICRFLAVRELSEKYQQAVEGHCPWREGERSVSPIVVADALADPAYANYAATFAAEGINSVAFIPLCTERGVVGKIVLYAAQPGTITPNILDAAQDVAGCAGVAIGRIIATQRLERIAALLATTGAMARIGGWELDIASESVTWSDEVYRIHEVPLGERITLHRAINFYAPEARARITAAVQSAIERGTGWDLELPLVTATGRCIWVRAQGEAEFIAGRAVRLRGAFQDITERRSAQDRMTRSMRDLVTARNESRRQAVELAARAAEMESLRNAAEASSRSKSEFLANMSHEIRTPLTAILGYTDLLRDPEFAAPERRDEIVETVRSAGQHLLTIINDILDLSKIEAGRMTVESVETALPELLAAVHRLMCPRAGAKHVGLETTFESPLPDRVLVDPTRLRQILLNLVGNATKFTDSGAISIRARLDGPESPVDSSRRLVIDIDDTGTGISDDQQARLFTSFSQADATVTRRHGGSGLGLIICRRLAQLMGGNVSLIRSAPGRGSTFRVNVPVRPCPGAALVSTLPSAPTTDQQAPPSIRLHGRILYAEDGIDNQRLIALHLRRAGADLSLAENGRAALDAILLAQAQGRPFELLLADMQMPEMDGYTLAQTLRARGCPIPIIALTAHAMAEDRDRCLAAGCDDYASKPIDKAALLGTCAKWLAKPAGRRLAA
jgi:signal transduction histidine kinase